MKLEIGKRVDVQGRFIGTIVSINENSEFPYLVKADEGFEENCCESELYEIEEV